MDYYGLQRRFPAGSRWADLNGDVVEVTGHALRHKDGVYGPQIDAVVLLAGGRLRGTIDLAVLDGLYRPCEEP